MADAQREELWRRVLAAWDDDVAHAAFLEHCRASKQLGAAAARYREQLGRGDAYRDPGQRDEVARKRLAAIAALAMLEIEAARGARGTQRSFAQGLLLAACLGVFVVILTAAFGLLLR